LQGFHGKILEPYKMSTLTSVKDPKLLPYGAYLTDYASVLFDRNYHPIVHVLGKWPDIYPNLATPCPPSTWIKHDKKVFFYNDGCTPRRDGKTRATLYGMLESIPALGAEVRKRDAAAERSEKKERNEWTRNARVAALSPASQEKIRKSQEERADPDFARIANLKARVAKLAKLYESGWRPFDLRDHAHHDAKLKTLCTMGVDHYRHRPIIETEWFVDYCEANTPSARMKLGLGLGLNLLGKKGRR
jgi:hypothetical protein